jgi:hypothetical protein
VVVVVVAALELAVVVASVLHTHNHNSSFLGMFFYCNVYVHCFSNVFYCPGLSSFPYALFMGRFIWRCDFSYSEGRRGL